MPHPVKIVVADRDADDSTALTALLETVFSNTRTANFFSGLSGAGAFTVYLAKNALVSNQSLFTTIDDRDKIAKDEISDVRIVNLISNPDQYRFLNLGPDATGYVFGVDGYRHQENAERTLIHELTHAMTGRSIVSLPGADENHEKAYFEQLSVFAGNAVFGSTRLPERQGHLSADWTGGITQYFNTASASQTAYIDGTEQIGFAWSTRNPYSAEFTTVDSAGTTVRTYWRGNTVDGGLVSNYTTSERTLNDGTTMFTQRSYGFGFYAEPKTAAIIDGSIVAGGIASAQRAFDEAKAVHFDLLDARNEMSVMSSRLGGSFSIAQKFDGLGYVQNRLVTVAAERFEDGGGLNWEGPVTSNGTQLSVFHLNDAASSKGAYLLGGSGYDRFGIDLTNGSDRIHGGSGGDVIAVGNGTGVNMAWGGAGDDVMIANHGNDWLFGEAEDDVFMGLGHGAKIDGGIGFDLATYKDSFSGVAVGGGTVDTLFGTDTFSALEAIIGSEHGDVFGGNADMFYFGGFGSDEFHLLNGDIASGGDGADKFYIDTSQGGNILILDFNGDDQLFVDGALYTGIDIQAGWHNETMPDGSTRTVQVREKISSFDHVVEHRQLWQKNADGSVSQTLESDFSVYGDLKPDKSDSFVISSDKGMVSFDNAGTTTNVVFARPSGQSFGMMFEWLGHSQIDFGGEGISNIYSYVYNQNQYNVGLHDTTNLIPQIMGQFDLLM